MLRKYLPLLSAIIFLLAAFVVAEFNFAQSFNTCINENSAKESTNKAHQYTHALIITIRSTSLCSARLIDTHNGFFAAFASLVIAAFTFTLWRSSARQADLTREAMIAGERAFVFATGFNALWEIGPDGRAYCWRFRPIWQNSGDTPTKDMLMHTECVIRDTPLPPGFNFNYPTTETGTALIPPRLRILGGQAPRAPTRGITPQDILGAQIGRKFIYLWGWAKVFRCFSRHSKTHHAILLDGHAGWRSHYL